MDVVDVIQLFYKKELAADNASYEIPNYGYDTAYEKQYINRGNHPSFGRAKWNCAHTPARGRRQTNNLALYKKFIGVILLVLAVFTAVSLASYSVADPPEVQALPKPARIENLCGPLGAVLSSALLNAVGWSAFVLFVPLGFAIINCWKGKPFDHLLMQTTGLCLILAGLTGLFGLFGKTIPNGYGPVIGPGGYLGITIAVFLEQFVALPGVVMFLCSITLAGTVLTMEIRLFSPHRSTAEQEKAQENPSATDNQQASRKVLKLEPAVFTSESDPNASGSQKEDGEYTEEYDYSLPDNELLTLSEPFNFDGQSELVQQQALQLERVFADFGFEIEVVDITTGPVVSLFELSLAKGLRLSKITALSDDLGIALKVPSVRIVAPIPGKNTVGVELPNEQRQMVRLRDVIEGAPEAAGKFNIPIYLGKDVSGRPMVCDLAKLPHLLIAGRTGTGKSVCLNSIIVSMLMTRTPEQVRMLMIDPKMVELNCYSRIPHLMHPVITDMRKAEAVLGWAVDQMEERYQLLAAAGVRQLKEYNVLSEDDLRRRMKLLDVSDDEWEVVPKNLPYIVIVADEFSDLMMTAPKDVETHIIRLAQKSRAVGIHLILATQKPTVNVVTGLIKSNLPARVAFSVATRTDSMVVLDQTGADRLLGNGDMLFLNPETGLVIRGQGTYVGDSEIETIVKQIGTDYPDYVEELVAIDPDAEEKEEAVMKNSGRNGSSSNVQRDELYYQAVECILMKGIASGSYLQMKLGIGYGRAARLMEFMEEDGIVGPLTGKNKPRDLQMTLSDWRRKRGVSKLVTAPPSKEEEEEEYEYCYEDEDV